MGNRTYTFNVSKVDQIFDILSKDKEMKFNDDHKIPSLE